MKKKQFTQCASIYICRLRDQNSYPTAHVYENAINAFIRFAGKERIPFKFITKENEKQFELYLKDLGRKPNTISTYLRTIRSIYNKAVENGDAVYIPRLFRDVYTGVESLKNRAIESDDMQVLLQTPTESEELQNVQTAASIMFLCCGMAFADLAHLKSENIKDDILEYHRKKSGTAIKIAILPSAQEAMDKIKIQGASKYLFPFLSEVKKGLEAFREYHSALAKFNRQLKKLAKALGLNMHITSY